MLQHVDQLQLLNVSVCCLVLTFSRCLLKYSCLKIRGLASYLIPLSALFSSWINMLGDRDNLIKQHGIYAKIYTQQQSYFQPIMPLLLKTWVQINDVNTQNLSHCGLMSLVPSSPPQLFRSRDSLWGRSQTVECEQLSHELDATVECFYSRGPRALWDAEGNKQRGQN